MIDILPNPACPHTQTFKTHDGKVKCLKCLQIVDTNERNCPVCQTKPHGSSTGKSFCPSCQAWFYKKMDHSCPICHKSNRVQYKYQRTVGRTTSEILYCHACRCEFSRRVNHSVSMAQNTQTRSIPVRSGATTNHSAVRNYGRATTGNRGVEGICPSCNAKVTVYSKRGGWCNKCQEYVYPLKKRPKQYLCEEEV